MKLAKFGQTTLARIAAAVWLGGVPLTAQVLVVDQASGDTNEVITQASQLPNDQLAQSFTPSLSAVGFVQFNEFVPAFPGNDQVTFMVNLRAGAYNGPVLSSTAPVVLVRGPIEFGTFYFPVNVPVTPGQLYFFEPVLLSTGSLDMGTKPFSSYLGGDLWSNGLRDPQVDLWFREGIVVPEPRTVWLLLFGGTAFFWLVRRKS
jgi:hypothetical protein